MKIFVNIVLFIGFIGCLILGIYTITGDIDKTFRAIFLLNLSYIFISFARDYNKETLDNQS